MYGPDLFAAAIIGMVTLGIMSLDLVSCKKKKKLNEGHGSQNVEHKNLKTKELDANVHVAIKIAQH